jgi:hypothetical protein
MVFGHIHVLPSSESGQFEKRFLATEIRQLCQLLCGTDTVPNLCKGTTAITS